MAQFFDPNTSPATGDETIWDWIVLLVSAGWRFELSGDGTAGHTQDDTGAPSTLGTFTDAAPFQAGGGNHRISNVGAWGILVSPVAVGGIKTRISFWRNSATQWRFAKTLDVSDNGALDPAHLPPPTAPDVEALIFGGGTPGAESAATFFGGDGSYHAHHGADSTTGAFYMVTIDNGAASMRSALMLDRIASGSGPAADFDPFVVQVAGNETATFAFASMVPAGSSKSMAWIGATAAATLGTWQELAGASLYDMTNGTGVGFTGVDQVTLKETLPPVIYFRRTSLAPPNGWKGVGTFARFRGSPHANGDLATVSAPGDWICFQDVFVPWPTGTAFVP